MDVRSPEFTDRLLRGDPEVAAVSERKSVRLFVSSTFTDTRTERNYFMRNVFPDIRKLCSDNGVEFSIVDMRWGIRDEATNDHMTTEICLSEISKCLQSTIAGAPCFIYLAFNRYGAPPLPRIVPVEEMDKLLPLVEKSKAKVPANGNKAQSVADVIRLWYRKDENACPAVYTLQPISTNFKEFVTTTDANARRKMRDDWFSLSSHMLKALGQAANQCPGITPQQQNKWVISTTHDEVNNGILASKGGKETSLCYCRDIEEFEKITDKVDEKQHGSNVWRYMDADNNDVIKDAQSRQKELRREVKSHGVPTREYSIKWVIQDVDKNGKKIKEGVLTEETHKDYVKNIGADVHKDLTERIKSAIEKRPELDAVTSEIVSHVTFCSRKTASFYGRDELVKAAMNYYTGNEGRLNSARYRSGNKTETVFVVHGVSGSGKTSLMAKVVNSVRQMFQEKKCSPVMVTRFCGTSGASSSARNLLHSMCEQISRVYPKKDEKRAMTPQKSEDDKPVPTRFAELKPYFQNLLKKATSDKPLVIHIDSLDQLSDEDNGRTKLDWLPYDLPPYVYLMVSTLPDVGGCLEYLKQKSIPPSNFLKVDKLSKDDGDKILKGWLGENKRKLQKSQFDFLLKVALDESKEAPSPLRLRLLSDIALKWTSYEKLPTSLPATVEGLIDTIFCSLEKTHGSTLMSAFCGLLAAAKQGISENDLVDIMSTDDEVLNSVLQYHKPPVKRLPYHLIARLKFDLRNYLVDRGEYNKTVLYWFHRQFWQCAEKRYLKVGTPDEQVLRDKYALLLIKYFCEEAHGTFKGDNTRGLTGQPLYWQNDKGEASFNLARLTELPYVTSKASEKLYEMYKHSLCNLSFIAAKCAAGRVVDLASDYDRAIEKCSDVTLLQYSRFVRENAHIFDKDPDVVFQQILNASDAMKDIRNDATKVKTADVMPWMKPSDIPTPFSLVNRSSGDKPVLMTIPGEPGDPSETRQFKFISAIDVGKRSFVVIATQSSHFNDDSKHGTYYHIFDASSGAKLLHLKASGKKEGSVWGMELVSYDEKSFHILHHRRSTNYDDIKSLCTQVYCKTISVGETLMPLDGPSIPMLLHPDEQERTSNYLMVISYDKKLLVTSAIDEIEKGDPFDRKKTKDSDKKPQTALKVWDLPACMKATKDEKLLPICCREKDFVITKGLKSDMTVEQITWNMHFSPNDKYIVIKLDKKLTIVRSRTLEPVWTWDNDKGPFFHIIGLITCTVPKHPNSWLILFDGGHNVGVTTIVVKEKDSELHGHLGWCSHTSKIANPLGTMTTPESVQIVGLMEKTLHTWQISAKALKKVPPTKLVNDCKKVRELPLLPHQGALQLIGTNIASFHMTGTVCYSLSKEGEIKIIDIGLFQNYSQADKIDYPVSVCRLSVDHSSLIVAGGPLIACFDAKTGKLKSTLTTILRDSIWPFQIGHVAMYNKDFILFKTERGVNGETGTVPMSVFNEQCSYYSLKTERNNGTFILEPCTKSKPEKEQTFQHEEYQDKWWSSDLSVSYDKKLLCKPPSQTIAREVNEEFMRAARNRSEESGGNIPGGGRVRGLTPLEPVGSKTGGKGDASGAGSRVSLPVRGGGGIGSKARTARKGQGEGHHESTEVDDPSKYSHKLLLILMNTETGEEKTLTIHRYPTGIYMHLSPSFCNQYRGAFSHCGKYFAAWGNFFEQFNGGKSALEFRKKHWPPMIKLYEFDSSGDMKELSKIEDKHLARYSTKSKPSQLSSLYFLPGDEYLLSTTRDGKVQIRGPLPELSVTTEYVTNQGPIKDSDMIVASSKPYLVTGAADRTVRVWKINLNPLEIRNIAKYHNACDVESVCGFVEEKEGMFYVHYGDVSGAVNILKMKL